MAKKQGVMDLKQVRREIGSLLDQCKGCPKNIHALHPAKYCGGCNVYERLCNLRPLIDDNDPVKSHKKILGKKQDMTKSDIEMLLSGGVLKPQIRKALGLNVPRFNQLMEAYGFVTKHKEKPEKAGKGKKRMVAPLDISIEEYVELSSQGLKDREICAQKGFKSAQLANWKYGRRDELKNALKEKKLSAIVEDLKPEVLPTISAPDVEILPGVSESIDPEENQDDSYQELESEYKAIVKKAGDAEAEYKGQLFVLKQQLNDLESLHAACADVENELHELKIEHSHLVVEHHQLIEDYQELVTERTHLSYDLENTRDQLSVFDADNKFLADENKLLKEMLVLRWAR